MTLESFELALLGLFVGLLDPNLGIMVPTVAARIDVSKCNMHAMRKDETRLH
jgi:hypothetical protein